MHDQDSVWVTGIHAATSVVALPPFKYEGLVETFMQEFDVPAEDRDEVVARMQRIDAEPLIDVPNSACDDEEWLYTFQMRFPPRLDSRLSEVVGLPRLASGTFEAFLSAPNSKISKLLDVFTETGKLGSLQEAALWTETSVCFF